MCALFNVHRAERRKGSVRPGYGISLKIDKGERDEQSPEPSESSTVECSHLSASRSATRISCAVGDDRSDREHVDVATVTASSNSLAPKLIARINESRFTEKQYK